MDETKKIIAGIALASLVAGTFIGTRFNANNKCVPEIKEVEKIKEVVNQDKVNELSEELSTLKDKKSELEKELNELKGKSNTCSVCPKCETNKTCSVCPTCEVDTECPTKLYELKNEAAVNASKIQELEREIINKNSIIATHEETIRSRNNTITSLENDITNKNTQISDLQTTITNRNSEITELQNQISELETTITTKNAIIEELETAIEELEGQISDLQDEIDGYLEDLEDYDELVEKLENMEKTSAINASLDLFDLMDKVTNQAKLLKDNWEIASSKAEKQNIVSGCERLYDSITLISRFISSHNGDFTNDYIVNKEIDTASIFSAISTAKNAISDLEDNTRLQFSESETIGLPTTISQIVEDLKDIKDSVNSLYNSVK